eukprot:TRINITY_DN4154_c0_g1_i2.p1 TRINITY_DN4154_c0_g1~~TRINITY_DN4154_c0_g1_i2.p1  ORF type:complete len:319 (+),score=86.76 TRINITY_DN4154_c0_g1_i2:140-1096(+)
MDSPSASSNWGMAENPVDITDEMILEPYEYLAKQHGKGIRPRMIKAFDDWLNVPKDDMAQIISIIQMLHDASLMLDDIEDNSKLRRGNPAVHVIFGLPQTINTANYVIFLALQKCMALGNQKAVDAFSEELVNLHRGQALDIYWRDNLMCPTEAQYLEMVTNKTAGLFRLSIKLMQAMSDNAQDFTPLVNSVGRYFQILDDYINLQSTEYMQNKSFCEDLTEGKFSFPILHSVRANPNDTRLLNILKQRTEDVELKKHALRYMEETKSFEYTLKVIKTLYDEVVVEITNLGGNETLLSIMDDLFAFTTRAQAAPPTST